jgi:hypothetical protein
MKHKLCTYAKTFGGGDNTPSILFSQNNGDGQSIVKANKIITSEQTSAINKI